MVRKVVVRKILVRKAVGAMCGPVPVSGIFGLRYGLTGFHRKRGKAMCQGRNGWRAGKGNQQHECRQPSKDRPPLCHLPHDAFRVPPCSIPPGGLS